MEHLNQALVDGYSHVRLCRGVTNALTIGVVKSLAAAIDDAESGARGVLLLGGEKFFSNGVDLAWALEQNSDGMRELFLELGRCILKLLECRLPVVGVCEGHAIGGAFALLLACDYRYAARGHVLLGKPEMLLGVANPYYSDQLFRFVAGDRVASDLIYTGRLVESEEARSLGFIHDTAEKGDVEALGLEQLCRLGALAPEAFAESKRMRLERLCARIRAQMSARVARQVELWNSDEAQKRLHEAAERLAR